MLKDLARIVEEDPVRVETESAEGSVDRRVKAVPENPKQARSIPRSLR